MSDEHDSTPAVTDEVIDRLVQAVDDRMAAFEDRLQANLPDLRPFHAALAEIMDALAQQIEDGRDAAANTLAAVDRLHDRIDASSLHAPGHGPPDAAQDLAPVVDALVAIRDSLSAEVADTRERVERALDVLAEHGDARRTNEDILRAVVEANRSDFATVVAALEDGPARPAERVDLEPLRADIERIAGLVEHLARSLGATVRAAAPDLEPVRIGIEDLVRHVDAVGDALQAAIESSTVDLMPVTSEIDAVRETVLTTRPDLAPLRTTLDEVLGALAQGITETRQNWDRTERAISAIDASPDLAPVEARLDELRARMEDRLLAVDAVRDELRAVRDEIRVNRTDLGPLEHRIDGIEAAIGEAVNRIESAANPEGLDLGPMRDDLRAVAGDLGAAITAGRVDLGPVADALERLRLAVEEQAQATSNDARGVRTVLTEVVTGLSETRESVPPVGRAVEALEATLREREPDLDPVLDALSAVRADIAAASPDTSDELRETEARLGQRVDAAREALRARLDDQRALTDNLAANISQLNAALIQATEEPQQLRRDLERILDELARRLPTSPAADGS